MPITSPISLRVIEQAEFAKLDYQVMRHAFDSQNELGRLCDEVIYQNDLAARLEAAGLGPIRKEVPVTATHKDFSKSGVGLGGQRLHLAAPDTALRLTALTDDARAYEQQLRSLFRHSPLSAVQWINMAHHRIDFVTLGK